MNTSNHNSGDIVKIPQNTILYINNLWKFKTCEKPYYGVYIEDEDTKNSYLAKVLIENEIFLVDKSEIYPEK